MKTIFTLICFCLLIFSGTAQGTGKKINQPDPTKKIMVVETACGQCRLGLPGKSCDLAIRINGKAYFVDGTNIDDHGDAHAKDGFCNAIRKAEVQGEIVNNRFKATYFKLIHAPAKKDEKKS